ncbi:unnamed protein product [Cunninghamella blakesleeana]
MIEHLHLQKDASVITNPWADIQKSNLTASYEYLCHIGEVKEWIEDCIQEELPSIMRFEENLRNGIILAKLSNWILPESAKKIYHGNKLQFRHSDNINHYFTTLKVIDLPITFWFELPDLYDKKNIPKVIYSIHALSHFLAHRNMAPCIKNLVGKLEFTNEELNVTQKELDSLGVMIPNFKSLKAALKNVIPEDDETHYRVLPTPELINSEDSDDEDNNICAVKENNNNNQSIEHMEYNHLWLKKSQLKILILIQSSIRKKLAIKKLNQLQNRTPHSDSFSFILNQLQTRPDEVTSRNKPKSKQLVIQQSTSEWGIKLQAHCRGYSKRRKIKELNDYYLNHLDVIIWVQRRFRKRLMEDKIKHLVLNTNESETSFVNEYSSLNESSPISEDISINNDEPSVNENISAIEAIVVNKDSSVCNNISLNKDSSLCEGTTINRNVFKSDDVPVEIDLPVNEYLSVNDLPVNEESFIDEESFVDEESSINEELSVDEEPSINEVSVDEEISVNEDLSVNALRAFAHLLNDCDFDFDCELAINELRQQITERIQENNQLDGHINTLDIYIALFVKNAATLEEVMMHSGALKKNKQKILRDLVYSNSLEHDPHSLNGIDKISRQRLEHYQHLIYLLQTEPKYLARLLSALTNHQLIGEYTNYSTLVSTVLSMFSYATNSREEYLLINLCKYCISEEIKMIHHAQDFLRGNHVFMKLILQTNRGVKEREFFKKLIQPLVAPIIENEYLDLEINPINIYKRLINEEEINTGIPTSRPLNVSEMEAFSNQDVKKRLFLHLNHLQQVTEQFLISILSSANDVPYGIRIIARELRQSLESSFPSEPQDRIVKIIGHFLYYRYLNPAIIAPEQYDVINTIVNPNQRKNLAEISKMLHYISSGKTFDDHYLSSLNKYVITASERFSNWFLEVTNVEDPEFYFGIDALDDYMNTQKPTVYMNSAELFHLHYVLENNIDILQPEIKSKAFYLNSNDIDTPLYDLVKMIGSSTYKPNTKLSNEPTFPLSLCSHRTNLSMDNNTRLRQIAFDTKRLVVHVIKNQTGSTILGILQAPVDQQHEEAWENYKIKEFLNIQSKPYNDMAAIYSKRRYLKLNGTETLLDLNEISFLQLKQLTHRLLLHLERCNIISEDNGFQSIINMIAHDISEKNVMRKQRERELERMKTIIVHLNQKREYLLDQSNRYEDYFNGCMESMANKKNKKGNGSNNSSGSSSYKSSLSSLSLLFSSQYFHIRSLQKSGIPVPQFGTYKYTAKQLYDRGILVNVDFIGISKKNYDRIAMVFSMNQPGIINIVAGLDGSKYLPAPSSMVVTVDLKYEELLQIQYEGSQIISLLDDSVKVNLNLLIYFINKKFYS